MSAFARVQITGYQKKEAHARATARRRPERRRDRNARDFQVTPPAARVSHRWWDWIPLRRGRGSYLIVIKLLDPQQPGAIACGQTEPFGGLEGSLPSKPPQLREGQ